MRILATVKYWKKRGESEVLVNILVNRSPIWLHTGVFVRQEDWDEEKQEVKPSDVVFEKKQMMIEKCKGRINDILITCKLGGLEVTRDLIEGDFYEYGSRDCFLRFMEREIEKRKSAFSNATYRHHKSVMTIFREFREKIRFNEINEDLINDFTIFLRKRNNQASTISKKIKIIQVYVKRAVNQNFIKKDPLVHIKHKSFGSNREYLLPDEVKKLRSYYDSAYIPELHKRVLKAFLFSCFTGLRISDVYLICYSNIKNNILELVPQKTRNICKHIKVPLDGVPKGILNPYGKAKDKIFNLPCHQIVNRELKKIMDAVGIDKTISYHCSRHTFATCYLRVTRDLAGLQKLLGHTSINDTMIYSHVMTDDLQQNIAQMKCIW